MNKFFADIIKQRMPDKPFMLNIGTSHTFGECDGGQVEAPYGKLVANHLGLEHFPVGLRGASNTELLQIINELIHYEILTNDNCYYVLLEPRIIEQSLTIPRELMVDADTIDNMYNSYDEFGFAPLFFELYKADVRDQMTDGRSHLVPSQRETVNDVASFRQAEELHEYVRDRMREYHHKFRHVTRTIKPNEFVFQNLKAMFEYSISRSRTLEAATEDFVKVDAMKNMILGFMPTHCKFNWFVVSPIDQYVFMLRDMQKDHSNLYKYLLDDRIMYEYTEDIMSKNPDAGLYCDCHHLTQAGHQLVFGKIIGRIEEFYYDKKT